MSIYTAAYKQDNFAVVDKVIKQFDEQIIMSADKALCFSPLRSLRDDAPAQRIVQGARIRHSEVA